MDEMHLLHARADSGAIHLDNDTFLITGGGDKEASLSTSELMDFKNSISIEGPRLPSNFIYHCVCHFNETHIFMGTGGSMATKNKTTFGVKIRHNAYLLNLENGGWFGLPDIIEPRHMVNKIEIRSDTCVLLK